MGTLQMVSLSSSVLLLGGIFLLVLGLLQLFVKSWFNWRVNQFRKAFGNQVKGSKFGNTFGGIALTLTGVFLLLAYLFIQQKLAAFY